MKTGKLDLGRERLVLMSIESFERERRLMFSFLQTPREESEYEEVETYDEDLVLVRLPVKPEYIAKKFDLKGLSK